MLIFQYELKMYEKKYAMVHDSNEKYSTQNLGEFEGYMQAIGHGLNHPVSDDNNQSHLNVIFDKIHTKSKKIKIDSRYFISID